MKKIQLISNSYLIKYDDLVKRSSFANPISFDSFDINIIDFSSDIIWKSYFCMPDDVFKDVVNMRKMLSINDKSLLIVIFPQNIIVGKSDSEAKNYLEAIYDAINQLCGMKDYSIFFENSLVSIGDESSNASFAFSCNDCEKLLFTKNTSKTVAFKKDNIIITSVDIIDNNNPDLLFKFLKEVNLLDKDEQIPDWVRKYNFYNDNTLNLSIEESKEIIKKEKEKIRLAQEQLNDNLKFKKLLYANSDELVEQVFRILENIFDISLKNFIDEKKEDFNFKKDGFTFIGEIKGVTSNVKSEYISQLNVHVSKYNDKLQEESKSENIIALLIINYERNRECSLRNEIHVNQESLAKKLDILIIDSVSLLDLFEKVLNEEISREEAIKKIVSSKGIFKL